MLTGLWKLAWVEVKVFLREPMGAVGALVVPVLVFVVLGRALGAGRIDASGLDRAPFNVAVLAGLMIAVSAVMSLIAIMAIYREGGILKRLRATPLSPVTILSAHVVVKMAFTSVSVVLLILAGRNFFPGAMNIDLVSFAAALLLSTLSILSTGFLIASIVPTARFAQPIGAALFYPMVAISGLFFPVAQLPEALQAVALALPTTHAVSLMQGVWDGVAWTSMWSDVAALLIIAAACVGLTPHVFRWE